jgi:hypothetical protein
MGQILIKLTAVIDSEADYKMLSDLGAALNSLGLNETAKLDVDRIVVNEPIIVSAEEPKLAKSRSRKPAQAEPAQAEPAQAEPAQAEPAQAEPAQAEPAQAELPKDLKAEPTPAVRPTEPAVMEPTAEDENPATYVSPKGINQTMIRAEVANKARGNANNETEIRRKLADFGARNVSGLPTKYFDEFYEFLIAL